MTRFIQEDFNYCRPEIKQELFELGVKVSTLSGCLPWEAQGMNSINKSWFVWLPVTPIVRFERLLDTRQVPTTTPRDLLRAFKIFNVRHLKIDAEGSDGRIMAAFVDCMKVRRRFRPLQISWECSSLTLNSAGELMANLSLFGYACRGFHYTNRPNHFRSSGWYEDCACALRPEDLTWPMHHGDVNSTI